MNDIKSASGWRCLLTWLAATAAATALITWAAPDLALGSRTAPFDAWLTCLCAVATALCAGWGWVVTSVVVLEALSRRPRASATPGVPSWVRRLVLAACGVAMLGSAPPALAAGQPPTQHHEHRAGPILLDGLPLPDRAEGGTVAELVAETFVQRAEHHVVRPGDSLWSIAEGHLGDPNRWPQLYALNRDVIGPDPDLIRPGQLLRLEDIR